jgi:mono/diheme cytochrome c family protein
MPAAAMAQESETSALGKEVFLERSQPQCAICHSLADADATGDIGPDLDELMPSEEQVRTAVTQGVDVMPAYADLLTKEEIAAVAHYVATSAAKSGN